MAKLHALFLNSQPYVFFNSRTSKREKIDWQFDHKLPRIIFLSFSFLVTEPLNLRHSFLYVWPFFKQHNSYSILINGISTHLAIDLIRHLVCSFWTRIWGHTHTSCRKSVSSSSMSTINHTKPKPRGLPTHNCHCHSSSSLNGWSHAHYC